MTSHQLSCETLTTRCWVLERLKVNNVKFERLRHPPAATTEAQSYLRRHTPTKAVKAMLVCGLKQWGEWAFAVLAVNGDRRVDFRAAGSFLDLRKVGMASKCDAERVFLCASGTFPPFTPSTNVPGENP